MTTKNMPNQPNNEHSTNQNAEQSFGQSVEQRAQKKSSVIPALPKNIYSLTSTRFIAAFAIVFHHFQAYMGFDVKPYTNLVPNLYLGVDFFFILSGFIMTHSYLAQIQNGGFSFVTFMKRRFARVYPIHFAMLMAFCALGFLFYILGIEPNVKDKYTLSAIPINIILLQAWGLTSEGTYNTPSWSISAEWFAYLIFLPLCLLLTRLQPIGAILFGLVTLSAIYALSPLITGEPLVALAHNFGVLRIFPEFLFGIALYMLLTRLIPTKAMCTYMWLGTIAALFLCAILNLSDLITIALFGVLIFTMAARSVYSQSYWLDHKKFVYLGEISYSMYMTHAMIYTLVFNGSKMMLGDNIAPLTQFSIWSFAIIICFPIAMIAFHLIEEPCRKFINRRF